MSKKIDVMEIEHDPEIKVWALDENGALGFFGYKRDEVTIRVLKAAPETTREREKYSAAAKLFGITHKVKAKVTS